jgi:hypothetical protein
LLARFALRLVLSFVNSAAVLAVQSCYLSGKQTSSHTPFTGIDCDTFPLSVIRATTVAARVIGIEIILIGFVIPIVISNTHD